MSKTMKLFAWVSLHGVASVCIVGDAVAIGIEWTDRNGEHGVDVTLVRTMSEARAVLGY